MLPYMDYTPRTKYEILAEGEKYYKASANTQTSES
jgi:hypothetical protein